jgi:hypothetical protein
MLYGCCVCRSLQAKLAGDIVNVSNAAILLRTLVQLT